MNSDFPEIPMQLCTVCEVDYYVGTGGIYGGQSLCHCCAETRTKLCTKCDKLHLKEAFKRVPRNTPADFGACDSCISRTNRYWLYDAQCNRWFLRHEVDEGQCDCGGIYSWNYTPSVLHFKDNIGVDRDIVPFLGLELEVEHNGEIDRKEGALAVKDSLGDVAYCMHDGSLGRRGKDGFEIVFHPITYEWFEDNWDRIRGMMKTLRAMGYRSWNSGRCGMHVHISRQPMSEVHQLKWLRFIYGSTNLAMCIGRRGYNDPNLKKYSPFDREDRSQMMRKITRNINPGSDSHYAAINATRASTLEARFMRGTLSSRGFRKNVEFIQSTWEFARLYGIATANEMNYLEWLRSPEPSLRFPTVLNYIERNYLKGP